MKELTLKNSIVHATTIQKPAEYSCSDKFFYGFVDLDYACRGFLMRNRYKDGAFEIITSDELTRKNGWEFLANLQITDLNEAITTILSKRKSFQVFVFEDKREFFEWLTENNFRE